MSLIKVRGIVIKETTYKDNDKILTILTDEYGKISCIAKGAKRTNSPILAASQYLVYSEFVLYKRTNYFYVNNATIINTFYNLRVDFDKLQIAFELTRIINMVTDENQDLFDILKLFLNTMYFLEKSVDKFNFIASIFKIKMFGILGFAPNVEKCSKCGKELVAEEIKTIYYDYVSNLFVCNDCIEGEDKRRYIEISKPTFLAIKYVLYSDIKKVFSFELKNMQEFNMFGQAFSDALTNSI